jgi:2-keto-myo-inositol isomerase
MINRLSRRDWLHGVGITCAAAIANKAAAQNAAETKLQTTTPTVLPVTTAELPQLAGRTTSEPFGYCLNTSTIRGQKLPLVQELEIAAKVGYQAVEPWLSEVEQYQKDGGTLADLKKRIADLGLTIESVIAFAEWIVDDSAKRAKALEQLKREMDVVAQFGGKRIACPPSGATNAAITDLRAIAERYRAVCELGTQTGVAPELEIWGFSKTLGRLGEAAQVLIEAGQPNGRLLPDVYHLFKGGSDFEGFRVINGRIIPLIHMNDYPGSTTPERATDALRVYPGDGIAPLGKLLRTLKASGFNGYLSIELFNRQYWEQDATAVARTALEKTRTVVLDAMKQ